MKTRAILVLAAALSFVSLAKADDVTVQLTGVQGGSQGGVYTSPYFATITEGSEVIPDVMIVCDDYSHEVWMGEQWTASVSTFANLTDARFSQGSTPAEQAATLKDYDEVAYLYEQLMTALSSNPTQAGNISFAIWAVFDTSEVENSAGWTTGGNTTNPTSALGWLLNAQSQTFTAGEYSNFDVLTPIAPDSPQEYIAILPTLPTPEPSPAILLGFGLLGVLIWKTKAWSIFKGEPVC